MRAFRVNFEGWILPYKEETAVKWIMKYAYWLILTVFLGSIMLFGLSNTAVEELRFYVGNEDRKEIIEIYTSENGLSYVFLPSYAQMDQVTVAFPTDRKLFLGGIELKNGAACSAFSLNQEYEFRIGEQNGVIQFCRSANMPTLYIETRSGDMKQIYADKEHEEATSIVLYSPEGDVAYRDRNCLLKGRGNSTWLQDKKPFLLRLSDEADLLGMGEDSDWILLANDHDESNLHNKLLFDLANRACETWTPQCEYVDVYLNGQYNGLYLLAEKVESGINRLNIDIGAGDFLCTVDFSTREETLENPFQTAYGRTIAICEPNILGEEAKERIRELVNQQERILSSQKDMTQSPLVDIRSWACKYLVDEIAGNTDADLSSSYFYYSDGVFYGGPVWDYDMAFGNTVQSHYPKAFIAKNHVKYRSFYSLYYSTLFQNAYFFEKMSEIYKNDFLPVLTQMIEYDIQDIADRISAAAMMNQLRWPIQVNENYEIDPWARYVNSAESIIEYLKERTAFLNSALIDKVPYCTVQFEHYVEDYYWTVSVPRGSVLKETDAVNAPLYAEVDGFVWSIEGTDRVFNPDEPVMEDMVLSRNTISGQN